MTKEFISDHKFDFSSGGYHCFCTVHYKVASHWLKLTLSKKKDEDITDYLDRVYRLCHEAITEFELKGYKESKAKKEKKEAEYKTKPAFTMKDKEELLYSAVSSEVLNEVLNAYSTGI